MKRLGLRWDPIHEAKALISLGSHDLCAINGVETAPLLGLLAQAHLIRTPLVYLDIVVSEATPLKRLIGWVAGGAASVVYCSPGLAQVLLKEVGLRKESIKFVPWAIDVDFWKRSEPLAQPKELEPTLLTVGYNDRDFGVLFEAVKALDVTVEIVTSSRFVDPPPGITTHALSPRELREAYELASVVVVPLRYNYTASGITTMLEAMAMSKPVIATRTPATEYYTDGGRFARLVPAGDPRSIRDAVEFVLSDPSIAKRIGQEARDYVVANFSTLKQAASLSNLYKSLVPCSVDDRPGNT